jgi:hypothetical protein
LRRIRSFLGIGSGHIFYLFFVDRHLAPPLNLQGLSKNARLFEHFL